jgi:MATE family multidrug resistance protein
MVGIKVVFIVVIIVGRSSIAALYTSNLELNVIISDVFLYATIFFLFDSLQTVFTGILVGKGRQRLAMVINFVVYYLVAVPTELLFAFVLGMEITGIWIGLCVGALLASIVFGILSFRTPWVATKHAKAE